MGLWRPLFPNTYHRRQARTPFAGGKSQHSLLVWPSVDNVSVLRVYNAFPTDGRPWRLRWVNSIMRRPFMGGAMVNVNAVPFTAAKRDPGILNDWNNYSWKEEADIKLDAGMFPSLVIGSIWANGLCEEYPAYREFKLRVRVGDSVRFYAPWEKIDDVSIVPKAIYPLPGGSTQSRMLRLPLVGGAGFVILPCSEVFRFYYGSSTKLANMLLDATWITERSRVVGSRSSIDQATRKAFLEIGPYHDNADHVDIAQMYFGAIARRESEELVKRAIRQSHNKEYSLAIGPPFEGDVTIIVRGVEFNTDTGRSILAYQICSSHHPYPWSTLEYGRTTQGEMGSSSRSEYGGTFERTSAITSGESIKVVQGEGPGKNQLPHDLPGPLSPARYLNETNATYVERSGDRRRMRRYETVANPGTLFAMGTGAHDSSLRRVTIVHGAERGIPHRFTMFSGAVHLLEKLPGFEKIVEDVYDLPTCAVEEYDDEGRKIDRRREVPSWAFLDSRLRNIPRRVMLAQFLYDSAQWIIFDIEPRKQKIRKTSSIPRENFALGILRAPLRRVVSLQDIRRLFVTIIELEGVVGGSNWASSAFGDWRHATLWHFPDELVDRYAQRMVNAIKGNRKPPKGPG